MGIKSIKIKNLLSFDELFIENITDINCIIGRNNVGKSNLLKLIIFFYQKLKGERVIPPPLNSYYSAFGSITIEYDFSKLSPILSKSTAEGFIKLWWIFSSYIKNNKYSLTLTIHSNDVVEWSCKEASIPYYIEFLFPFFDIDARHIDLYDWKSIWQLISRLKTFNFKNMENSKLIDFINKNISDGNNAYSDYINKISSIIKTSEYTYQEKVLNYIKISLSGDGFNIAGDDLITQSDGTNSHRYIELFLELLISLTRTSYISPTIYIDEPEIGLHPKKNEELIYQLYNVYVSFKKTKKEKEKGKYKTPYPKIIMATHSPNIIKMVIKLFGEDQQVLHLSKKEVSEITKLNSVYDDSRFLNRFSDNEARLFFSEKILFVEGETEQELFSNIKLLEKFSHLKAVDVYASVDNSLLKYINPSYANAAIPYLMLYDADKFLSFDFEKEKFTLCRQWEDYIKKLKKKHVFSWYKKESINTAIQQKILDLEINLNSSWALFDNLYVDHNLNLELIKSLNNIVQNEHAHVLSTTIEGALINQESFQLFKEWLSHEINNNLYLPNAEGQGIDRIKNLLHDYQSGTIDLLEIMKLFSFTNGGCRLDDKSQKIVKQIKRDYYKFIFSLLESRFDTLFMQLIVLRMIFFGASNTLLCLSHKKYSTVIDEDLRTAINDFKNNDLKIIQTLFDSKVGGWVTKFMDFSIDKINGHRGIDFEAEFKLYFEELYTIITKLQFR